MPAGPGGIEVHAWALLSTALTEVLSKSDWLKLWDHVFSNSPPFLMFLVLSYLLHFRAPILAAETMHHMHTITRRCNPLDLNKVPRPTILARMLSSSASACSVVAARLSLLTWQLFWQKPNVCASWDS